VVETQVPRAGGQRPYKGLLDTSVGGADVTHLEAAPIAQCRRFSAGILGHDKLLEAMPDYRVCAL